MFNILRWLLLVLPFAVVAFGGLMLFKASRSMTKSDFKVRLKKTVFFRVNALIMAAIYALVFATVGYFSERQHASAKISLNYDEASMGQNANGTRYNMSEIICDEVLELAIESGALVGVDVEDLKKCVWVEALVQGNSFEPSTYHISTEFMLYYTSTGKAGRYDAETMVQLISEAYKDYYFDKYVSNFTIDEEKMKNEIAQLDYKDTAEYLMKTRNMTINYLSDLQNKNNSFVADDGTTFASISEKLNQLGSVQINNNLIPFILQNGLSKKPTKYGSSINYVNLMLGFDRDRAAVSYNVTNNAIMRYAEEMTRVVLVPTWDADGKYYMGRTKVGIDELSVQAMEYSDSRVEYEESIQENNLILSKMNVPGANSVAAQQQANEMIDSIVKDLVSYGESAHEIGQEYYANRMNQCISILVSGASIFGQVKIAAAMFIFAYCALIFMAMAQEIYGKNEEAEDGR